MLSRLQPWPKKARALICDPVRGTHPPKGSISGPADQPDYKCTVPCSTAAMETPCKWAWECESHGHQKGEQVSFITATQPIHSTNKKHQRADNLKSINMSRYPIPSLKSSLMYIVYSPYQMYWYLQGHHSASSSHRPP